MRSSRASLGCLAVELALAHATTLAHAQSAAPAPNPSPSTSIAPPAAAPSTSTPAHVDAPGATEVAHPFGPGANVEISCDKPDVVFFVAKGVVDDRVAFPDPFVKIGRIPTRLQLPPGVFTVLVEGQDVTSASTVFEVRQQPVQVRVRAGSQGLRDLSTLSLAIGGAAVLAGIVLELSGTSDEDPSKKRKLSIPLFIGGGVGIAGGVAMSFASSTSIEHNGFLPPEHSAGVDGHGPYFVLTGQF